MNISLRNYQQNLLSSIYKGWQDGHRNMLAVSPTGSGKAFTLCTLAQQLAYTYGLPTMIQVHRKELVAQLCMSLSQLKVSHNIIAQTDTITEIIDQELREYGKKFYDPKAPVTVVSVDTLLAGVKRGKYTDTLSRQKVWILDEAAHQLKSNKWGQAINILPDGVLGVGFTATPQRLDKKGLGRHAFGLFDEMVIGPTVRYLIDNGFLSRYKIAVPVSNYRQYLKDTGNSASDYTHEAMVYASMHSSITGDVVENYVKFINGKQAIVFADSIKAGLLMEDNFNKAGVNAKFLAGDTPSKERTKAVQEYRQGIIRVLINVDLFDEGFDVPGTDAVIMARPTKSLGKYLQMCGRALRVAKGKEFAVIIDHVGNVEYHGLPDRIRKWTLDNIVRKRDTVNLIKICSNVMCKAPFDRVLTECPYCGQADHKLSRAGGERSAKDSLKMVDGDMFLLDPETIRELEKESELEDPNAVYNRVFKTQGVKIGLSAKKKQEERIESQRLLAAKIADWCGNQKEYQNLTDRQINKKFYLTFGSSITAALSLIKSEMDEFRKDVEENMWV